MNPYIHLLRAITVVTWTMLGPTALAERLTGEVVTSGNPEVRQTMITISDTTQQVIICPKGRRFELTQLAGSVVTIDGVYKKWTDGKSECFYAETIAITEIVKGRPAITGQLKMIEKNKFGIVNSEGKTWILAKLPRGAKELIGKQVAFDLVANDASGTETTWLIARAFAIPTP